MQVQAALSRDLVLVGGGHTHALVLRMLAMKPLAGLRITLVSPASHTPYSGMLPGLIAGHYNFEQAHIDLARLCQWAGVRFIEAEVTGLDPGEKRLSLAARPDIFYDIVSIDIGSQPELDSVPGARAHAVPVKPVADLWRRWRQLEKRVHERQGVSLSLAIVGGGAGSVELALAMAHALRDKPVDIQLFCGAAQVLQGYNAGARATAMSAMQRNGIELQVQSRVVQVDEDALLLASGERWRYDDLFWCTGAAAATWVAASGLDCDDRGFLQIADSLQSTSDDAVFGAGDIATQVNHPRPKAGVYAVRQAPVLARNLRAALLSQPLELHRPQQRFLSLLSLGDRRAAADKGLLHCAGKWVWRWKDHIDRKFMRQFERLPPPGAMPFVGSLPDALNDDALVCGGCGAKVGATGLSSVLAELADEFPGHCVPPGDGGDAAPVPEAGAGTMVQSLDMLRELVADPWLMGRIAANHALSDLYACGAQPICALAAVTLPFARDELLQRELKQILSGALQEFARVDCALIGGHSMQGKELQLGFAVTGKALNSQQGLLCKRPVRGGDALVLTKPLGTGVLFAAHMRQLADGRDIAAAVAIMLQSNYRAAQLALMHKASACTDVTGFGLLGHLLEMLADDQCATLQLSAIPALPGVQQHLRQGVRSTMHEANSAALARLEVTNGLTAEQVDLLLDPQTSGGLLVALDGDRADDFCAQLRADGFAAAIRVGKVEQRQEAAGTAGFQVSLR